MAVVDTTEAIPESILRIIDGIHALAVKIANEVSSLDRIVANQFIASRVAAVEEGLAQIDASCAPATAAYLAAEVQRNVNVMERQ